MEKKYHIKVNEYKLEVYTSVVRIPQQGTQGSVVSRILWYVYTDEAMEGTEGEHAEYCDDKCV